MSNGFRKRGPYERFAKRPLDFIIASISLLILLIPMSLIALMVRIKLGAPVIFSQDRPGKDEKIFRLYKFRTMTDARDENGNLLSDEERLTPFGKRLRETSLDEIPELFNIIKGDMSIVGPRPLLVRYLPRYNEEQRHRHDVRPGLTGYAQAHGRNALSWAEKFSMDVWYTKNVTFKTDLDIIAATVRTVIKHEGISADDDATMPEFMGNEE